MNKTYRNDPTPAISSPSAQPVQAQLSLRLNKETLDALRALAANNGVSLNSLCVQALSEALK